MALRPKDITTLGRNPIGPTGIPSYGPAAASMFNQLLADDQYDIALFTASIHSAIKEEGISEDFTLATLTPGQIEYITEMYKVALCFRRLLPDKEVAERVKKMIVQDATMRVILARNKEQNFLVRAMLNFPVDAKPEAAKEPTIAENIRAKLPGGKKKEEMNG